MLRYQNFKTRDASLLMVYFSYFHSITCYGIIFWGNPHVVSIYSYYKQKQKQKQKKKKRVRTITGSRSKESCRKILGKLSILTLYSQHIFHYYAFLSVIRINIHNTWLSMGEILRYGFTGTSLMQIV